MAHNQNLSPHEVTALRSDLPVTSGDLGSVALGREISVTEGHSAGVSHLHGLEHNARGPEVISGENTGYIRTAPNLVSGMLAKSFEEGAVVSNEQPEVRSILHRLVDVTANFGQTTIQSARRRHGIVEEYRASADIGPGNGSSQNVSIRMVGALDASQLGSRTKPIRTPVGDVLAEPKVEIRFTQPSGEKDETHLFVFGRNGTTYFERSLGDENGSEVEEELTPSEATGYLMQHLPSVQHEAGGSVVLSQGHARLSPDHMGQFFTGISRGRLDHNYAQILEAKREQFGYDAVTFVPPGYFETRNRNSVLFSVDYPQGLIPVDVLEHAEPGDRIRRIAEGLGTEIDEQTIADTAYLLDGLPAGTARVALLVKNDQQPVAQPELRRVPTTIFDKAAAYLLQNPGTSAIAGQHKSMHELLGTTPVSSTAIQIGLEAGLLDRATENARVQFGEFASHMSATKNAPEAQQAISEVFTSLVKLGAALKRDVYSQQDLTQTSQGPTLLEK